ncbi:hypothetical protein PFICI_11836 [Pestalotiopsis fici W106-1]|uniref:BTB domain-containing protein n=1 Tax=Pestalotiopsis fici (strain W106-1 / CGMCC3.15140) TaxID=1229662 RepID=W3WRH9_PESFW|nr:uncharacterized protein PFICI_11836 [Pestalotiopsis fici W106-1]ETS76449.1 hypothetical protein PFICI_11836 [Pestalotiopsis fici W106-1]
MESDEFPDHNDDAPTCTFLCEVPGIVDIDERGDRVLHIGTNKCEIDNDGNHHHTEAMRFRVCSRALSRLSPVLGVLFFGPFLEANQDMVYLPEDDPKAMKILLYIAHGQIDPVYEVADRYPGDEDSHRLLEDLYDIFVVANKYLVTQPLRPWTSSWSSALLPLTRPSSNIKDHCERLEKLLYISSEVGHFEMYNKAFLSLVSHHQNDREMFSTTLEPDGVKDRVFSVRLRLIEETLGALKELIDPFLDDNVEASDYDCSAKGPMTQINCRLHTLAVILRHLKKKSLFPLPEPKDVIESAASLHGRVTKGLWSGPTLHKDCAIRPQLSSALSNAYTVTTSLYLPPAPLFETMSSRATYFGFSQPVEESEAGPNSEPNGLSQDFNYTNEGWGGELSDFHHEADPWGSASSASWMN